MGRLAGDSKYYRVPLPPYSTTLDFISVTTVTGLLDKSGPLIGWAWNVTTEGIIELTSGHLLDLRGWDQEMLKKALKGIGATPWVKRDRAADRGQEAHDVLERLAKGEDPEQVWDSIIFMPEEVQGYAQGAFNWFMDELPEPFLVEEPIFSLEHLFAGTLDFYGRRTGGELVLTDLKTSKAVYDGHVIQGGGYKIGLLENGRPVDGVTVVRATPDGKYHETDVTDDPRAHPEVFLGLLRVWNALGRKEG